MRSPRMTAWSLALILLPAGSAMSQALLDEGDTWVARKGGVTLTLRDIDAQLDGLSPAVRAGMMNDPRRIEKIIEDMLLNRQLAQKARDAGRDKSPYHAAKVRLAEEGFLSQEFLDNIRHGLADDELELIAMERYMLSKPSLYGGKDERRDLQHILISLNGRTQDEARQLADEIHGKILAGEDFDELAKTYSADKAKADSMGLLQAPGLLSEVARGATVADFEAVAFAMKTPGEISQPVMTQFGFHIIKLIKIYPEERLPFEAVREAMMAETGRWLDRKRRDDTVTDLRSLPVEGNPDVIAGLRTRYKPSDAAEADKESAE